MNKDTKLKKQVTEQFVKDAFVIDGNVELILEPVQYDNYFKCTDRKRGVFKVSWEKQ